MEQPLKNKYDVLILPLGYNKSFLDFSEEEVQKYYQWFLNVKSDRLAHLCSFLFTNRENCLNEKNLNVIEFFLLNSISTAPKPKEQFNAEMEKAPVHLKPYAKPDGYLLDEKTISICYDIGIFMGELIIKLDNRIKWKLEIDNEYADYGQPILVKKNIKLKLNPFRVAKNVAATIYEDRYSDNELINVFSTWKRLYKVREDE